MGFGPGPSVLVGYLEGEDRAEHPKGSDAECELHQPSKQGATLHKPVVEVPDVARVVACGRGDSASVDGLSTGTHAHARHGGGARAVDAVGESNRTRALIQP